MHAWHSKGAVFFHISFSTIFHFFFLAYEIFLFSLNWKVFRVFRFITNDGKEK